MSPGLYTELFFLDEAVALAAGHRPCAECRRDDYTRFRAAWARAVSEDTSADGMDVKLHADRLAGPMIKRRYQDAARASGWRLRRHRRRRVARLAGRAARVGGGRVRRAARAGRRPRHGDHAAGHRRRDPRRRRARRPPERGPRRRRARRSSYRPGRQQIAAPRGPAFRGRRVGPTCRPGTRASPCRRPRRCAPPRSARSSPGP